MKKKNKFLALFLFITGSLCAWDDHPDRDEERRNQGCDSQCFVEGGSYDWSKRDRDSKDDNSSGNDGRGTVPPAYDRGN